MAPVKAIDSRLMRGNFSQQACHYDRYATVQRQVVNLLSTRLPWEGTQTGRFLDVGTGTGSLAAALIKAAPARQMVVMDIAHGMTRESASRLPAVCACDGDARLLPFADNTFTAVVSSSVYQWVDDLPGAFAEVARVLVPEGFLALAMFGERTLHELRTCHRRAVSQHGRQPFSHVQRFPSVGDVSAAIALAGLSTGELFSTVLTEYHRDVADLLRRLKRIGASNAAVNRPRGLASRRVMEGMMRDYEETYRCAEGLPASYEVIIAVARKP